MLSAWVFRTAGAGTGWARIISKSNGTSGDDYHLAVVSATNVGGARVTTGAGTVSASSGLLVPQDQWVHLCMVYDGANILISQDGEVPATHVSFAQTGTISDNNAQLSLGNHADTPSTREFTGLIADARIYDRALSDAEIVSLVHAAPYLPNPLSMVPFGASVASRFGHHFGIPPFA